MRLDLSRDVSTGEDGPATTETPFSLLVLFRDMNHALFVGREILLYSMSIKKRLFFASTSSQPNRHFRCSVPR